MSVGRDNEKNEGERRRDDKKMTQETSQDCEEGRMRFYEVVGMIEE
jgi:hypothetical protein